MARKRRWLGKLYGHSRQLNLTEQTPRCRNSHCTATGGQPEVQLAYVPFPGHPRVDLWHAALPRRLWPDFDLRNDGSSEHRARVVFHAGRLSLLRDARSGRELLVRAISGSSGRSHPGRSDAAISVSKSSGPRSRTHRRATPYLWNCPSDLCSCQDALGHGQSSDTDSGLTERSRDGWRNSISNLPFIRCWVVLCHSRFACLAGIQNAVGYDRGPLFRMPKWSAPLASICASFPRWSSGLGLGWLESPEWLRRRC